MSSIKRADLDVLLGDCECTNSGVPEHRSDSFQCPELTYVNMDTGTIASNKGSNDIPLYKCMCRTKIRTILWHKMLT